MDINQYEVIITPKAYRDINSIYEYIAEELCAKNAAKDLMKKVEEAVQRLKHSPKIYTEIEKIDELERKYRRIVIKNYVLLYTIDEYKNIVYIVHMYYGRRNYMNNNLL